MTENRPEFSKNRFRVLVVDDNFELIKKLGERILKGERTIAGTHWQVDFHGVYIEVVQDRDGTRFSDETLGKLVEACSNPPNLILADYGYSTLEQGKQLYSGELPPEQFFEQILSAPDLIPAVENFLQRERPNDKKLATQIHSSLRDNPCRLFLYTYTPPKFRNALPTVDARRILTQGAFQRSKVVPVDISLQLYKDGAFDVEDPTTQDKSFRAYLTTGLLEHIIQRELLIFVLARETERLRGVRYFRSATGVFVIVLFAGAIGAVGEWLGARIMALFIGGFAGMAVMLCLLVGVVFFILGLCVPFVVETFMPNLLTKLKSDRLEDS
jgi:hypothetical protein